ncbi:MAG: glucosyltransferase domain-containing protein [Spirochaetaceae bacterium]|nr:glucosyltransferase domain-containing protein [Spirochaetaceae bacterium]
MNYLLTTVKENKKYFVFYFVIALLAYSAVVFNDVLFHDDFKRLYFLQRGEFHGWWFSRLLQNILYRLTSANLSAPFSYLGALPQLLALGFYSLLALLVVKKFSKINYATIFLALAIVLFPYINENMLYKFDSSGMALALLLAGLPLLIPFKNLLTKAIVTIICIAASMATYQLAFNAYLILALFIAMQNLSKGVAFKEALKDFLINITLAALALIVYFVGIRVLLAIRMALSATAWTIDDAFGRGASETVSLLQLFPAILKNIKSYLIFNINYFSAFRLALIMASLIIFYLCLIKQTLKNQQVSNALKVLFCLILFLATGVLFLLPTAFILPAVNYNLYSRYLYSIGIAFALIYLYIFNNLPFKLNKFNSIVKIIIFYAGFMFISLTFQNTSFIATNDKRITFWVTSINHSLMQLMKEYEINRIEISSSSSWGSEQALLNYLTLFNDIPVGPSNIQEVTSLPILTANPPYYTIYLDGATAIIIINKQLIGFL